MDTLLTRRESLQAAGVAVVTLGFAPVVVAADSHSSTEVQPISVNGKALTGYWASQRNVPKKSGGR